MNKRMREAMDKSVKTGPVRLPKKLVKEIKNIEVERERLIQERFQKKKETSNQRKNEGPKKTEEAENWEPGEDLQNLFINN